MRVLPEEVATRWMVISERVSVPVLSEQITLAEPSVSTDDRFFTIALRRAMRCTPIANTTDRIAGSPSGTAATASDTPSSSTVITCDAVRMSDTRRIVPTTTMAITTTAVPSMRPMRLISFCSGVRSSAVASSMPAMEPTSVAMPVAVITARAWPCATAVPLKTMLRPFAERRRRRQRGRVFQHRLALAGERGFLHAQCGGVHQARIGADQIALGELHQVAAHQLRARDALHLPIAHHRTGGRRHGGQGGHRVLGLDLLRIAERSIERDDERDDDRIHRYAVPAFDRPGDERHRHRGKQQVDQRILQLREDATPGRPARLGTQLVGAVSAQARRRLGGAEPALQIGVERRGHRCGVQQRRVAERVMGRRRRRHLDFRFLLGLHSAHCRADAAHALCESASRCVTRCRQSSQPRRAAA